MHLKKYSYHTFALLLFCACINHKYTYIQEEQEGYYTQNHYKLGEFESFEETISIPESPDKITDFSKKLKDRIRKWHASGTEKEPYKLWSNFKQEIPHEIVKALKKAAYDTTPLENYYDRFGHLLKMPTEENEKEIIAAVKKLQVNPTLVQAFKACIAAKRNSPETIFLTKATLAYQEFLYFILNDPSKNNTLHIKLKKLRSNLLKWKEDGHPTGQALWKAIQKKENNLLEKSPLYPYSQNHEAIQQSFHLINQLANHPYSLSYIDLLETLPHGIKQLNDMLDSVALKESNDIKLLKTYLGLVTSIL